MTAALVSGNKAPYGARQLKNYIAFSTYRAFFLTNLLLAAIFAGIPLLLSIFGTAQAPPVIPHIFIPNGTYEFPKPAAGSQGSGGGNAAGTVSNPNGGIPLPLPNELITNPDPGTAFTDPVDPGPVLNGSGDPAKQGQIPGGQTPGGQSSGNTLQTTEPEFVAVDKEPSLNMADLQRVLEYPDIAKRAGISGKVVLRVLVGANGKAEDVSVVSSPNDILSEAAVTAVKRVNFTPAVQNAENVRCWLMVPIDFRLR